MSQKFKIGDTVTWTSSANGSTKTKTGVIVKIMPAELSDRSHRKDESYIVEVPQGTTGKAKPKRYWSRVNARRLINGPEDKMMAVYPLKHKWAWEILDRMEENTWTVRECPLGEDKLQFPTLSEKSQRVFKKNLAFLSNLDGIQFRNLVDNIGRHITSPEASMCVSRQAWEEAVHVRMYSAMAEEFCADPLEEIYTLFERDGVLKRKNEYIMAMSAKLGEDFSARNFALAVVANVALEGIYFFSGFLIGYVFARNGEMLQSADAFRYIQRDEEQTHLDLFHKMWLTLKDENPEIFDQTLLDDALDILRNATEMEINWGQYIIEGGIPGLTPQMVDAKIKSLANERAEMLGLPAPYPGVQDPVPWMKDFSDPNGVEKNFFEGKPTSYRVGGALEWD